jgi:hypothetical protein
MGAGSGERPGPVAAAHGALAALAAVFGAVPPVNLGAFSAADHGSHRAAATAAEAFGAHGWADQTPPGLYTLSAHASSPAM